MLHGHPHTIDRRQRLSASDPAPQFTGHGNRQNCQVRQSHPGRRSTSQASDLGKDVLEAHVLGDVAECETDDDPQDTCAANNRDMLIRRLTRAGYPVLAAEHGEQALEMIEQQEFEGHFWQVFCSASTDGTKVKMSQVNDGRSLGHETGSEVRLGFDANLAVAMPEGPLAAE